MHLSHLTLTGADDAVDPAELARLSEEFPLLEWGILMSHTAEGTPRFPGREWRQAFYRLAPNARRAAHVCGNPTLEDLACSDEGSTLRNELAEYQRVQLNFNARHLPGATLDALVSLVRRGDLKHKSGAATRFITQHNEDNQHVHGLLAKQANHAVLFDASGGTGLVPAQWPAVLPGFSCGYAGGLTPENIAAEITRVEEAVRKSNEQRDAAIWIDMESGIRTGDRFDMEKVAAVVDVVRRSLTAHSKH